MIFFDVFTNEIKMRRKKNNICLEEFMEKIIFCLWEILPTNFSRTKIILEYCKNNQLFGYVLREIAAAFY